MPSPDTSIPSPSVAESASPAGTKTKPAESGSSESRSVVSAPPSTPAERHAAVEEAARLYVEGKSMDEIAEKHGVKSSTIMRWMLAELGPEVEHLRESAMIAKAIENYEKLEGAETYIEVMRASQVTKHWNWLLERVVRRRFGPSLDVNATVKVELPDAAETARRMAFLLARGAQTVEGVAVVVPESVVADEVEGDRLVDGRLEG